jgi:hypothetical protein
MILRALVLAALFPLASFCQIQLFLFDGTNETAISSGSGLNVGTAAVGATLETTFHIRNVGTTSVVVSNIGLSGVSAFTILQSSVPTLPYILASGTFVSFKVDFSPTSVAVSDNATLAVNTVLTVLLRASATPASQVAGVYLDGATIALATGATIDFGSVQAGSSSSHMLRVDNSGGTNAVAIGVSGTGFQPSSAPASVSAGTSTSFKISFLPPTGQAFRGALAVGTRSFTLTGQGITPPAVSASIAVNGGAAVTSAQQVEITIPLGSAAQAIDTGTLTVQFRPNAIGATDDPAISFTTLPARSATVSITPGDTTARIRGNPSIFLQTGTTAGSIVLTLQLSASGSQITIPIAPLAISIDTVAGLASTSELTISITGFDNTHSAAQLAFTFYDVNNNKVSPGTINVDAGTMFQTYFASGVDGGAFALNASFPVTGNVTLISTAQVGLTNSAGTTQTERIPFP